MQREPRDNDIVIVEEHEGQRVRRTAKRWQRRNALVYLQADSDDPRHKGLSLVLSPEREDPVRVLAIALAVVRPLI